MDPKRRIISDTHILYGSVDYVNVSFEFGVDSPTSGGSIKCSRHVLDIYINSDRLISREQKHMDQKSDAVINVPTHITYKSLVALIDHMYNRELTGAIDVGDLMDAADWLYLSTDKIKLPQDIVINKVVIEQLISHQKLILQGIENVPFMREILKVGRGILKFLKNNTAAIYPVITSQAKDVKRSDLATRHHAMYDTHINASNNPVAMIYKILQIRNETHLMHFLCTEAIICYISMTNVAFQVVAYMTITTSDLIVQIMGKVLYLLPMAAGTVGVDGWLNVKIIIECADGTSNMGILKRPANARKEWCPMVGKVYPCFSLDSRQIIFVFDNPENEVYLTARVQFLT